MTKIDSTLYVVYVSRIGFLDNGQGELRLPQDSPHRWKVQPGFETSIRIFSDRPEADVYRQQLQKQLNCEGAEWNRGEPDFSAERGIHRAIVAAALPLTGWAD